MAAVIAPTPQFARSVSGYLDSLPATTLSRLYDSPSSCLAIFRLLPETARYLILNMLWMEASLAGEDLLGVLARRSEGRKRFETGLAALERLHIIMAEPIGAAAREQTFTLDRTFRSQMRRAITGGGSTASFGLPIPSKSMDTAELDQLAISKWESILHFMVGSKRHDQSVPSDNVLALLQRSGLMSASTSRANLKITSRGFQFLLEDLNGQLWELLLNYLSLAEERNIDVVEILVFLFMLGSLELGQCYSKESLSPAQLEMLEDLRHIGLIYQGERDRAGFYPTRLATTLTSSAPDLSSNRADTGSEQSGFIILETNYRLYAYTSNELQLAVLNLFVSLKSRFPNLAIGTVTRESVKAALSNGITAEQIISYLAAHAHPQMRKHAAVKETALLPVTVLDQIRIWENDKNRVQSEDGFLWEDFKSQADFELVRDYAQSLGALLWEDLKTRRFVVTLPGQDALRTFVERRKQRATP